MVAAGKPEIMLIYFVGTFGMIILAGSIFFFFVTYQKRLLKKELEINKIKAEQQEEILKNTILAQEKERRRIAGDLHDEVGALLSVVKLNVSRFEKKSENRDAMNLAGETKTYLEDAIAQVRRISRDLMPPSLEKLGLEFAVEELIGRIDRSGDIKTTYYKTGEYFRFDNKKELALFRIVQELLNNAIKHSEATEITVKSRFCENSLAVSVSDNGKGFNIENVTSGGLGLKNLESRANMLNAKMKINSRPGRGTVAIILINSVS